MYDKLILLIEDAWAEGSLRKVYEIAASNK